MKKYWLHSIMHWQNLLMYIPNFIIWQGRQLLGLLSAYIFWSVVFTHASSVLGYGREQMLTYIFMTTFLQTVIISSDLDDISAKIHSGEISNTLLQPISLVGIWVARMSAYKIISIACVVVESMVLFFVFRPQLIIPPLPQLCLFLIAVGLGAILLFYIMLLFGTIGFWSPDSWGVRFLFYMCVDFTAGKLYPLDILPKILQQFIFLTPFPYLSYIQTQLFLNRYDMTQILHIFVALIGWIVFLAVLFHLLWKKGMRTYAAVGR